MVFSRAIPEVSPYRIRFFLRRRWRHLAAIALVVLAIIVAIQDATGATKGAVPVVVATKNIDAGVGITEADVAIRHLPREYATETALSEVAAVVGKRAAVPITTGEALTSHRIIDSELAAAVTGDAEASIVAITPSDGGLLPVLNAGDRVDIIRSGDDHLTPIPVATDTRVLFADTDSGVVYLAAQPHVAVLLAASSIEIPLTLVMAARH